MRMLASRYLKPQPAQIKRGAVSSITHVSAPLKGLSLATKLSTGDPLTATILKNAVIEDDRISVRAGYAKQCHHAAGQPVWHLIPHYGTSRQLAATNNTLFEIFSQTELWTGWGSNDWHWTSFANLGQQKFTIMVNGQDGVISWDGGMAAHGTAVTVAAGGISKANPAVVTVAAGDISKFSNGANVYIQGATGSFAVCNGAHVIASVGVPANTFTLAQVDTSAAVGTSNAGITATPFGSLVKENVTAPSSATWINPNQFHVVLSHQNRLFFADPNNLAVYYLPLQQKSGEVKYLPLNVLFRKGGTIRALCTWTVDGGAGMDDQLVVFSSNGECVIYSGTDPDTDFSLVGRFQFDSPMSKHSTINWGGDLYVLISTGLVPMTTVIRAETEQLGQADRSVISIFLANAINYRSDFGWQVFLNPSSQRAFCNIPLGAKNQYKQMVRHMPRPVWSEYADVPARCWSWIDPIVYFGDDDGNVFRMHPVHQSDDGKPIQLDVQLAWSNFKTPAIKRFTMVQPYFITDGDPRPYVDVKVDYDYSAPTNRPDFTFAVEGYEWDVAAWDTADWAPGPRAVRLWQGVSHMGRVGAPRLTAQVLNCSLAITGFDVIWEQGGWL